MATATTKGASEHDLLRLVKILGRFRDLHAEVSVSQVMIFLYIAAHKEVMQHEIWKDFGFDNSIVSRSIASLTDVGVKGREGLKIVKSEVGKDRRERVLSLTAKGKNLKDDVLRDLGQPA
jgi:DNA-binding MarR family transcriptional regulator